MSQQNNTSPYSLALLIRIFLPFALGYFLSYTYRVVNNVIANDLAQDMQLDPSQLGLLTSAYLITFAAFQLPLGILLDRYGSRRVESSLLLFATAGALLFAFAHDLNHLIVARALIGFGVSACLMAAFKAFAQWFPKEKLPLVNGLQLASGGLGILAAAKPVEFILHLTDWRMVFWILALLTFLTALLIFFLVPDKPSPSQQGQLKEHLRSVWRIFSHRYFWLMTPWSVSTQAAFGAITGLWTNPWLRDVAHLDRAESTSVLTWMGIGTICGFVFIGWLAERLARIGLSNLRVASIGMLLFMLVQLALVLGWTSWPSVIWALFGFFGTTGVLSYAYLSQQFPSDLAGRVNTALNLLVFVVAFIAQWGIGAILKAYSVPAATHYAPEGYQMAFGLILLVQLVAFTGYLVTATATRKQLNSHQLKLMD